MYITDQNELYEKYESFVWHVIHQRGYIHSIFENQRIDEDDLFQQGYIGLIHANRNYKEDHESEAKFTTYAESYIRRYILDYMKKNYTSFTFKKATHMPFEAQKGIENQVTRFDFAWDSEDNDPFITRIMVDEGFENDAECSDILKKLKFQNEYDKAIWTKYYIEDQTVPQIAPEFGKSKQAIHARLQRINEYLRKQVKREDLLR